MSTVEPGVEVATEDTLADSPSESKMHRLHINDLVSYEDATEDKWPPVPMEGKIVSFANPEGSYLNIDFGEYGEKTLTEDEVKRVA